MAEVLTNPSLHGDKPTPADRVRGFGSRVLGRIRPARTEFSPGDTERLAERVRTRLLSENTEHWTETPPYDRFDGGRLLSGLDAIARAAKKEGANRGRVDDAYAASAHFVEQAFKVYNGDVSPAHQVDRVFAVPTRVKRDDGGAYASEVSFFLPLLDSSFGVDPDIRQRAIVGLPPSVIETYPLYKNGAESRGGAILYVPLLGDMVTDVPSNVLDIVSNHIDAAAHFAHERLGATVMGLGAILPSLTSYGRTIKQEGLITTTGHGGTVHLIVETARTMIEHANVSMNNTIGVIGAAGSIGSSSVEVLLDELNEVRVLVADKPAQRNRLEKLKSNSSEGSVIIMGNAIEVLRGSNLIISAITETIDLNKIDPNYQLDLGGKIIIDDSQPGCFTREQVEARGGRLVWVVGQDQSQDHALTREHGYNFGNQAGLYGNGAVWGCEAEAYAIARTGRYDLAINRRVTSVSSRAIGELFREVGVGVADPQAYGKPIDIPWR